MLRSYRYRIYPTRNQRETLDQHLAICCELYNAALQERRDAWARERKRVSWFDQNYQTTEVRAERADVAQVSSLALQHVLRRADLAFKAFFRRVRSGERPGYPRFKSAHKFNSLTVPHQIKNHLRGNKVRFPNIGHVRIKLSRPIQGTIKTLTIKREADRWFVIFACADCPIAPIKITTKTVGIDVGLHSFATLSTGEVIDNPRWFRSAQTKLRRLQRRVARRRRGSNRRRKAALLLQRFHNHIRDQRRDFHHKESRKIVNNNGLIAVEHLNVKGLASGMLAKSVNDAGWSNFLFMLAYKAESAGRVLVKVDPRGTSQTCICGAEVRKTLAQRWHLCLNCGLSAGRDHVSAQIILGRAERLQALTSPVAECVA